MTPSRSGCGQRFASMPHRSAPDIGERNFKSVVRLWSIGLHCAEINSSSGTASSFQRPPEAYSGNDVVLTALKRFPAVRIKFRPSVSGDQPGDAGHEGTCVLAL